MSSQKRPESLTELIHLDTKDFLKTMQSQYQPHFNNYSLHTYNKLIQCYSTHITEAAFNALDSNAVLAYFACYKGVLRESKVFNKRLADEGLTNQIRLKQCLEIKGNFSKSNDQFEQHRQECLESYRNSYLNLYNSTFKEYIVGSEKKE